METLLTLGNLPAMSPCTFFYGILHLGTGKGLVCQLSGRRWSGGYVKTTIFSNGDGIILLNFHINCCANS
jgi:hypothetical protein